MKDLILVSNDELLELTSIRDGETKLGECFEVVPTDISIDVFLKKSNAKFVLIGVAEDVGVKANFGRIGTANAWENTLKNLVNIQSNNFFYGNEMLILGKLNTVEQMQKAQALNPENAEELRELRNLVSQIDTMLTPIIKMIVEAGKIPIVIGGGHNNSYGNIKGTALGKDTAINVINFDTHTDFRALEGRHSGNGFSYSFSEGFLNKYFMFGLHENYTSESIFSTIVSNRDRIRFNTYEQIEVRKEKDFENELAIASEFITNESFGIELDLDSLVLVPSSAMTPTGFSIEKIRRFLYFLASKSNASYLHICEAAPSLGDNKNPNLVGKLISYLISDFVKAKLIS